MYIGKIKTKTILISLLKLVVLVAICAGGNMLMSGSLNSMGQFVNTAEENVVRSVTNQDVLWFGIKREIVIVFIIVIIIIIGFAFYTLRRFKDNYAKNYYSTSNNQEYASDIATDDTSKATINGSLQLGDSTKKQIVTSIKNNMLKK